MAANNVLFTGATGHVGFRVLLEALEQGYSIRAAVRSEAKMEQLKSATPLQPHLPRLSFVIVPDMMKSSAFDEATRGMDAIIHVASPLPGESQNYDEDLIQPAIKATTSVLKAALRQSSIRRVVITSSSMAVTDPNNDAEVFTANTIVPVTKGPFSHPFAAYAASKVAALSATRVFLAEHEPHFTVINIMPSFVIGKSELARTPDAVAQGSNALALAPLLGTKYPNPMDATMCHIDDVARVHVAALDPKLQGNHNLGVNYRGELAMEWNDGVRIARKHFLRAVEQGILPLDGSVESLPNRFDASATEEKLGFKFKNPEEMITSVVSWYLEVHGHQGNESA